MPHVPLHKFNFNDNHPECQSDEVFFSNCKGSLKKLQSRWPEKQLRKGIVCYCRDGMKLLDLNPQDKKYYPVFAKKGEDKC